MQTPHGVESGYAVINHDAKTAGKGRFRPFYGPGFENVENSEQDESNGNIPDGHAEKEQYGQPLSEKFVDNDATGVFFADDDFSAGAGPDADGKDTDERYYAPCKW